MISSMNTSNGTILNVSFLALSKTRTFFTGKAVTFHSPISPPEKSEFPLTFDEDNEKKRHIESHKLISSPNNESSTTTKERIYLNLFYFAAGDSNKTNGLKIENMIDTGATCSIINYPTFLELSRLGIEISVKSALRTYTGFPIRMLVYFTLKSSFDTDGKYIFPPIL